MNKKNKKETEKKTIDIESTFAEMAKDFFQASFKLQEGNKSAENFGRGLACYLTIWDARSKWSKWGFFKSGKTGLKPVVKAIQSFSSVSDSNIETAGQEFTNLLNTLYCSAFRNHEKEASKSILEVYDLKKIFMSIEKDEKELEKEESELLKAIEEEIPAEDWKKTRLGDWLFKGSETLKDIGTTIGSKSVNAIAEILAAAGGMWNTLTSISRALSGANRYKKTLEKLEKYRDEYYLKISKFIAQIQKGIKKQYAMNKIALGKEVDEAIR